MNALLPCRCILTNIPAPPAADKPKLPVPAGTRVMVTGWGYNSSAQNTFPERLQQLSLNLFSNQECQKRLGNFNGDSYNFYTNAMICAAGKRCPGLVAPQGSFSRQWCERACIAR